MKQGPRARRDADEVRTSNDELRRQGKTKLGSSARSREAQLAQSQRALLTSQRALLASQQRVLEASVARAASPATSPRQSASPRIISASPARSPRHSPSSRTSAAGSRRARSDAASLHDHVLLPPLPRSHRPGVRRPAEPGEAASDSSSTIARADGTEHTERCTAFACVLPAGHAGLHRAGIGKALRPQAGDSLDSDEDEAELLAAMVQRWCEVQVAKEGRTREPARSTLARMAGWRARFDAHLDAESNMPMHRDERADAGSRPSNNT